jgi:hypothetical protein
VKTGPNHTNCAPLVSIGYLSGQWRQGHDLQFIKSTGLTPCFALASLQNSPRIQLVGNDFCVRESIGSIEPTVFTGFFFGFHNGIVTA